MYNATFLPQFEEFRRFLWGAGCIDTQAAAEAASIRSYVPLADVKILPCHEDALGEWVPYPVEPAQGDLGDNISPTP